MRNSYHLLAVSILFLFALSSCTTKDLKTGTQPQDDPVVQEDKNAEVEVQNIPTISETPSENVIFDGELAKASYNECFSVDGLDGVFYVDLLIENKSDFKQVYALKDVYVDDVACQSGTGMPVIADVGRKANGSFIIFCQTPLSEISEVEFALSIMNESTFREAESSDAVVITP